MKILYGKKLFTFDKKMTISEAIAFDKGEIVKIGKKEDLISEFPKAEVIDKYKDQYIYPSWIEPHSHVIYASSFNGLFTYIDMLDWDLGDVYYKKATTKEEFYLRMEETITQNPGEERYMFYGWTEMMFGIVDYDKVRQMSNKPILIVTASTHKWYTFNGMDEYLNLSNQKDSQFIKTDKNGIRVSYTEQAVLPAMHKIGEIIGSKPEIFMKGLTRVSTLFKKYGVSSMSEHGQGLMDVVKEDFIMKDWVEKIYNNKIRLVSVPWLQNWFSAYKTKEEVYKQMENRLTQFEKGKSNFFYDRWIKIHFDGAIKDEEIKLSMHFNNSDYSGSWNYSRIDEIVQDVQYFWDRGYSFSFHTQGDASFDKFIEIYDTITKTTPKGDKKYRIEHLGFPPERFFKWLASKKEDDKPEVSGFSLYMHLYKEGFEQSNKIPMEIRKNLSRFKSVLNSGSSISFHSDYPNAPTNPLFSAWAAVTRESIFGNVDKPEEKLTREEGLLAITRWAAEMTKLGDITGSLEIRKKADINVLDKNLLECDLEEWKDLPSIQTFFEGEEAK